MSVGDYNLGERYVPWLCADKVSLSGRELCFSSADSFRVTPHIIHSPYFPSFHWQRKAPLQLQSSHQIHLHFDVRKSEVHVIMNHDPRGRPRKQELHESADATRLHAWIHC